MKLRTFTYTTVYSLLGTEILAVGLNFYKLYKANTMITFAGGFAIAPYWMLAEGCMVGIVPILTKHVIKAFKSESTANDSELVELIEALNNKGK